MQWEQDCGYDSRTGSRALDVLFLHVNVVDTHSYPASHLTTWL